jgi:hypothetical protein
MARLDRAIALSIVLMPMTRSSRVMTKECVGATRPVTVITCPDPVIYRGTTGEL